MTNDRPAQDTIAIFFLYTCVRQFVGEVTGEVSRVISILADQTRGRSEMQARLELKGQANFRDRYLLPALAAGVLEMTIPDKPNSRLQKYRLTTAGRRLIARPNSS